jgi:hypothetical protein
MALAVIVALSTSIGIFNSMPVIWAAYFNFKVRNKSISYYKKT